MDKLVADINKILASKNSSIRIEIGEVNNVVSVWQISRRGASALHHGRESDTVRFLQEFSQANNL